MTKPKPSSEIKDRLTMALLLLAAIAYVVKEGGK